ncbi:MAG: NUDIX domain-containing protein [Candidatus Lokiarchaeota archaeon]|nr:NUDIX domain-containing protein [Candidatus Lokiarchaeota archaeon]MBD3199034.1 NUDIX domain-containing protein [Candidatus Lokiarchaeota archaeon]
MPRPKTPLLTVDAVILYDPNHIVLIKRKNPPFQGEYALPGGFVDMGETVEAACIRESKEETNIKVKIRQLIGVFSEPERDPRGHTVSIAFLCEPATEKEKPKAQDDAAYLELIPLDKVLNLKLAFDHLKIIKKANLLKK